MDVDKNLLLKVAEVARLKLSEEEIEKFIPQMKEILECFSQLNGIDTDGVRPSFQPIPLKNRLREDSPREPLTQNEALKNSKFKQDGYFRGPKAV